MKTEAIRQAAERLRTQGHFGLASQVDEELTALEESHRTLTGILADMLLEDGHLHECQYVNDFGTCSARCANVRAALKTAGATP